MVRQIVIQKQLLNVLPQQIQLLKLFHLPTMELQQRIQEELNDNPLLEETLTSEISDPAVQDAAQDYQDEEEYMYDDIPDYKLEHNNYLSDQNLPQSPISNRTNFRNDLKEQLGIVLTNPNDIELADYLVDSLNGSGMLEQTVDEISDDYSFKTLHLIEVGDIERIRSIIKEMSPGGVGCFTIREFLVFQLQRIHASSCHIEMAISFLENYFKNAASRKKEKMDLPIDQNDLKIILQLIRHCKLKPIDEVDWTGTNASVIPDFVIRKVGDDYDISLYNQRSATLFINQSMNKLTSGKIKTTHADSLYLKNKLNSAQWFIEAIKLRESTMQKVMQTIVELQSSYFKTGDISLLKPMTLKNITDRTGVNLSTVSRITCNKYADTHFGTILLKSLFSEGIENADGKNISNRVIQTALGDLLKKEDKQDKLTDIQLVGLLATKGFKVARRTVAKYREHLRIPSAQMRGILGS